MAAVKSVTSELASTETNLLSRRAERPSGRLDAGGLQLPPPPLHDKQGPPSAMFIHSRA